MKKLDMTISQCEECPYYTTSVYYMHCNKKGHKRIVRKGKPFPEWCPLND